MSHSASTLPLPPAPASAAPPHAVGPFLSPTPASQAAQAALTRLAAIACGTPMASLGWFTGQEVLISAAQGLAPHSGPAHASPHALLLAHPDEVLTVPALARDRRLASGGFAKAHPEVGFFAGAAIMDEQGQVRGCLAVHDLAPRTLAASQVQALRDLASLAATVLTCEQRGLALEHLTITDPLTGLSNRKHFDQALAGELAHAMRLGEPFTVLRMELDGFQAVQEGFGHAAADEVLCEVARRLSQQVRQGDVLARLDGDEFGVVMRHGAKDSAQVLAKRIVKAVSAPILLSSGDEIGVGISIGMAAYSDAVGAIPVLLKQADQALFEAKKQNERRWKMFVGMR